MSELLVPVIDGKIGDVSLHRVKAEKNSGGLTIYDDNDSHVKEMLFYEKVKNTFERLPSVEVRFDDYLSKNSCIQFSESTQSITLGFLLEIYRALNNRNFREKWDYIVATGDVEGNLLESVTGIDEKFKSVLELKEKTKKKILFVYVNDEAIIKNGVYDEYIQILHLTSKNKFDEVFYHLFETPFEEEQTSILKNIIVDTSNEFVETETYLEIRDEIITPDSKYQGYLLVGQSNSGKSVIAYNLCHELMRRNIVYAPIWITINNNKLQEILNPKDANKEFIETRITERNNKKTGQINKIESRLELVTKYLFELIKNNQILSEKKYILVIDNLELSYVDEILNSLVLLKKEYPNILLSIVTSWCPTSKNENLKELRFKQIELTDVNFSDFEGILNSVIEGQFTTKLQLITPEEKKQLTQALYNELKDCPGDLALTLSSLRDISVHTLIEKLNETGVDSNSKRNYFYNLKFEQLGLFSQIVLFQFIGRFGCDVCNLSNLKELEKEIKEKRIIDSSLVSFEAIEKAIRQLVNNYIIQSNYNNEYFIKNGTLKFFLFSCNENITALNLSRQFIDEDKKIHMAVLYNWDKEFETIVIKNPNPEKHFVCLVELAANSDDTKLLDIFFKYSDIDINLVNDEGWSAIHFAARFNPSLKVFKYLIGKNADYRLKNDYDQTVLHLSVGNPEIEILKYILNEHLYKDIDDRDTEGWTPLLIAARYATKPVYLELLINAHASYKIRDNENTSVLHLAACNEQADIIDYVINKKLYEDINELSGTKTNALFFAVENNDNIEVTQKLIDNGCRTDLVDTEGATLLHYATYNRSSYVIEYLLENHLYSNIDAQTTNILKLTPLHSACRLCNNPEIISILLENKASLDIPAGGCRSIYHSVVMNRNESVVDYIFEHYPVDEANFKDNDGLSLVHVAIRYNDNVEVIKKLRKRNFDFSEVSNTKKTVLHFAAQNKNPDIINYVLKHHIYKDINERNEDGWTALHFAAAENPDPDIMNLLLRCGADYKLRANEGQSVLMLAAMFNTEKIISSILHRKLYEDINEIDVAGYTVFHYASRCNNGKVLNLLYKASLDWQKKAIARESCLYAASLNEDLSAIQFICDNHLYDNIDETFSDGYTAIQLALSYNPNVEVIKYLLLEGARTDTRTNEKLTSLHCAVSNPNIEIMKFYVENKLYSDINEVDKNGYNALFFQISYNKTLEGFRLLEKAGCDTTIHFRDGRNLLQIAISKGTTDIINYLLDKNCCDINESNFEGDFPLSIAIKDAKNLEYVKNLISHGADFTKKTSDGKSLLLLACEKECSDIVTFFLQEKMYNDIDEKDKSGFTALHYAVRNNENTKILEQLLNYNCDYKKLTNNGDSIISLASENNYPNVLNYIISNHLYENINKKNGEGHTALHLAAWHGNNIDNIKQLFTAGANLSEENTANSTVLHLAAANKDERMVRLLIEELDFEDIEAKNDYGNTALHVAAAQNNIPAFKYLTQLGINPHELNYSGESAIDLVPPESKGLIDDFMKNILY